MFRQARTTWGPCGYPGMRAEARPSVPRPGVFAHRRGTYVFGSPATLARWSAEAKGAALMHHPRARPVRCGPYTCTMAAVADKETRRTTRSISRCAFCSSIAGESGASVEVPVLEDERFVAWVSRGPLVDGHVIMVPRQHLLNLGQLSETDLEHQLRFIARLTNLIEASYGPVALFEHGPVREGTAVGCSIDHAHLHLVPVQHSLVDAARRDYPELSWRDVDGYWDVREIAWTTPYLFVRDPDGASALAVGEGIPSQALRRTIAAMLGREGEWDWKVHPRSATILKSIRELTTAR